MAGSQGGLHGGSGSGVGFRMNIRCSPVDKGKNNSPDGREKPVCGSGRGHVPRKDRLVSTHAFPDDVLRGRLVPHGPREADMEGTGGEGGKPLVPLGASGCGVRWEISVLLGTGCVLGLGPWLFVRLV